MCYVDFNLNNLLTTNMDTPNSNEQININMDDLMCPITQEMMDDPVMASDGHTYERAAIADWINRKHTSPITNEPITDKLHPNFAIKKIIAGLKDSQKIAIPIKENKSDDMIIEEMSPETRSLELSRRLNVDNKEIVDGLIDNSRKIIADLNSRETNIVAPYISPEQQFFDAIRNSLIINSKPYAFNDEKQLISITPKFSDDLIIKIKNNITNHVCIVIDASYSMIEEATVTNENKVVESYGFSKLDIVIHAVCTIIAGMTANDLLSIVVYSQKAETILAPTYMTEEYKKIADAKVRAIKVLSNTNIWAGIEMGLDLLHDNELLRVKSNQNTLHLTNNNYLLLLTDGVANVFPPRSEIDMVKSYLSYRNNFKVVIDTFGFGYEINSKFLNELAICNNGMNYFIPDNSFVGTVFVNATARIKNTLFSNCYLSSDSGEYFNFSLQGDQPRHLLINQCEHCLFQFDYHINQLECKIYASITIENRQQPITIEECRQLLARSLDRLAEDIDINILTKATPQAIFNIPKINNTPNLDLSSLNRDINGQIGEAVSRRDWFKKWGQHYLRSLKMAHLLEICSNFKDFSVQDYASKKFKEHRLELESIFCKLEPPKPSLQHRNTFTSTGTNIYQPKIKSMATYIDESNSCFGGDSIINIAKIKPGYDIKLECPKKYGNVCPEWLEICPIKISDVKKGDLIVCHNGYNHIIIHDEVMCVLETTNEYHCLELTNGLIITPWHPIFCDDNKWSFPINVEDHIIGETKSRVYNLILKNRDNIEINGYVAVTLGHSFKNDDVVAHPFFGSEKVIDNLKQLDGWDEGRIIIDNYRTKRDQETNLVCGYY